MGRSQESFSKREKEKKRAKKKKDKQLKKEQRAEEKGDGNTSLDDMIAYVDEYGNIVDTPPEEQDREEIDAEDIVVGVPSREASDEPDENTGKVAFYDSNKGFGFITDSHDGEKLFFHINNVVGEEFMEEGDKVKFDKARGKKGMDAINVERV